MDLLAARLTGFALCFDHRLAELKAVNQDHDTLLQVTDSGLYCEQGGFYVDPWKPVGRAVVTHAHADHLAWGCGEYLVARDGLAVARARLGEPATIATVPY